MQDRKDSKASKNVEDKVVDMVISYSRRMSYYSDDQINGLKQAFNKIRFDFPRLLSEALKHLECQKQVVSKSLYHISKFPDYKSIYSDYCCELLGIQVALMTNKQKKESERIAAIVHENKGLRQCVMDLRETVLSLYEHAELYASEMEDLRAKLEDKKDKKHVKRSHAKGLFASH